MGILDSAPCFRTTVILKNNTFRKHLPESGIIVLISLALIINRKIWEQRPGSFNYVRLTAMYSFKSTKDIYKHSIGLHSSSQYRVITMKDLFWIRIIFTARKRSLRRLCFHRCLSVHRGRVSAPLHAGIHTPGADTHPPEQTPPSPGSRHPPQCMLGDMGNKRAVCILLEFILV